jgi:hypothetical protein
MEDITYSGILQYYAILCTHWCAMCEAIILCWGMNIQNNDTTPVSSQYYVCHLITNKFNHLNC